MIGLRITEPADLRVVLDHANPGILRKHVRTDHAKSAASE
jgi:hypothetical protein